MLKLRKKILEVWSGKESAKVLLLVLTGFSAVYSLALTFRNFCFKSGLFKIRRLGCKVISVGNITVGGTGKTPMAIVIANILKSNGFKPAVLSRGYGGKGSGKINIISDGNFCTPDEVGDEPCLIVDILGKVPVLTSPDRYSAGKLAMEKFGSNVLVLDDGFQHRSLHRDINIALLDASRPFGNGFLIPRGPLRESPASLNRADLIILTRSDSNSIECEAKLGKHLTGGKKIMRARHEPDCILDLSTGKVHPLSIISGKKIAAFCGIAVPDSFRNLIAGLGGEIIFFKDFPDHHRYTPADMEYLIGKSRDNSPDLILTTDKDRMKLKATDFPGLFALRIKMTVDDPEFPAWITARLSERLP